MFIGLIWFYLKGALVCLPFLRLIHELLSIAGILFSVLIMSAVLTRGQVGGPKPRYLKLCSFPCSMDALAWDRVTCTLGVTMRRVSKK